MKLIIKNVIIICCFCIAFNVVEAHQGISINETDSLGFDSSIRHDSLANGLTYYIKDLKGGADKISMRLYVKVGNYYQTSTQLDFAHALEHLAFKCAKDFPNNLLDDPELFNRLEMSNNMGKRDVFGSTLNSYTWYKFDVPSNRMDALDTGLLWFKNISDLKLTEQAIDSEKGPLRQEHIFRQGDNLEESAVESHLKTMLLPNTNDYSDFFEHSKNFSASSLIEFYKQWYQPDRMGVVLIGDFSNIDDIEKRIRDVFSKIQGTKTTNRQDKYTKEYLASKKRFEVLNRDAIKNDRGNEVKFNLYLRDPSTLQQRGSGKALQYTIIKNILIKLINKRIKEAGKQYRTPYFSAFQPSNPSDPYHRITIRTRTGHEKDALHKLIYILRQLRENGLTLAEWKEIKQQRLSVMAGVNVDSSEYWMEQIKNHFVYGEALPENKNKYMLDWFTKLTLKEFNALYKQLIGEIPEDIGIIAPSGVSYTEMQVRGWIHEAFSDTLLPYIKPIVPKELMSSEERSALKPIGYTHTGTASSGANVYVLNNGLRIILDTLAESKDRFYLHGFRNEGASCFAKEDFFSAINSPSIVLNTGIGNLDKFELDRFLKEFTNGLIRGLWFKPYITYHESGILGNGSSADLEKILQLIYLFVTQPNKKNLEAFNNWKIVQEERHRLHPYYAINTNDYEVLIRDFLKDNAINPKGTRRFKGIALTDIDRAYNIYQLLFTNPSEFTFIISGDFKKIEPLPLLRKYLGNLPVPNESFSCTTPVQKNNSVITTPRYHRFSVEDIGAKYAMKSEMYSLRYIANLDEPLNWKEELNLKVLGTLMRSKMMELRFSSDFAIYGSACHVNFNKEAPYYDFRIFINAKPEELEMLRKACKEMIKDIKQKSFNQERFHEVMKNTVYPKYTLQRQHSPDRRGEQLYEQCRYQQSWVDAEKVVEHLKFLTTEDMQKVARKFLKDEYLMEFVYGR